MRNRASTFVVVILCLVVAVAVISVVIVAVRGKKQKGPWCRKDYLTKQQSDTGWGLDQWGSGGSDQWGSKSDDESGVSSKIQLNIIHFIMAPLTLLGIVSGLGGFVVASSGCPGKHSHKAHPLLADSSLISIGVGIAAMIASFIIFSGVSNLKKKKNIVFKKNIIRKELMSHFYIHEYIYNEDADANVKCILYLLNIAGGAWNCLNYNDYFSGKYKDTPFLFLDCNLKERVGSGKQAKYYERFTGQIIIMKYHAEYNLSHRISFPVCPYPQHFSGSLNPVSNVLELTRNLNLCNICASGGDGLSFLKGIGQALFSDSRSNNIENLMKEIEIAEKNGDIETLEKKCAELNQITACTNTNLGKMKELMVEIKQAEENGDIDLIQSKCAELNRFIPNADDEANMTSDRVNPSEMEVEQYISSISGTLNAVVNAAECNVSFIFSGGYLAILLENHFDPFEFSGMDTFRSYRSLHKRVQGQVHWLTLIFEALEKGNLVV